MGVAKSYHIDIAVQEVYSNLLMHFLENYTIIEWFGSEGTSKIM